MKWQDARECVKAYCCTHDVSMNHSEIVDFENGMLTSYEPEFDIRPIELSWSKLLDAVLLVNSLDSSMSKEQFLIWNDMHAVE